jgi:hypothetical protein
MLTLGPAAVLMPLSSFVPDDSVQHWLTLALPLVLDTWVTEAEAVPVSPAVAPVITEVSEAAPVGQKSHQPTKASGNRNTGQDPS